MFSSDVPRPEVPRLVVNTGHYLPERGAFHSDTSMSTPFSSSSSTSGLLAPDACSDAESGSLSLSADVKVKAESTPGTPFDQIQHSASPPFAAHQQSTRTARDPSTCEDSKKIRVNERSKTGCLTCRKRKKKCDENKPFCNNCTKTNYTCEGYPPPKHWTPSMKRSSRHGCEDESDPEQMLVLPQQQQQQLPTFPAVETEEDRLFLEHYTNRTSRILSLDNIEEPNPWTELILPIAKDDRALMHSVLAFAGSHLIRVGGDQRLEGRKAYHVDAALSALRRRLNKISPGDAESKPLVACMIFQFLMSKNDVLLFGPPHTSLRAARAFLQTPDTPFWRFALEFCQYHEFSSTFTSLPGLDPRPKFEPESSGKPDTSDSTTEHWPPRRSFHVLVGVVDVPFMTIISKTTMLRDRVRQRYNQGQSPTVHPSMLVTADELGRDILCWQSGQAKGTPRYVAAELYRWASFLYLLRTVRAATNAESRESFMICVRNGLTYLKLLSPGDAVLSGLLLPTFILGCGAFEPACRAEISHALTLIEGYSGFGNIKPARHILQHVWAIMDDSDSDRSWDWETLTQEMGYEALIMD